MGSYAAYRVRQFIDNLEGAGYAKWFICFRDDTGKVQNLVYDNREFFLAGATGISRPSQETLYALFSRFKKQAYEIIGCGTCRYPESEKVSIMPKGVEA